MVPVSAVAELLSAVRDALSDVYRGDEAAITRWAAVFIDAGKLPGSFELNAQYPSIRDAANLRDIERATAAIRKLLAEQDSQGGGGDR
jgi:hypothetical protein